MKKVLFLLLLMLGSRAFPHDPATAQEERSRDQKVAAFLKSHRRLWQDWNVPESDGRRLYDLIVKNNYKSALEIGTSTGRSTIWIAWALSKTGGRLITIEIDAQRHRKALNNFEKAGLSDIIDARLADAHDLVKDLPGPFDFIFCDADKDWYTNYFVALYPKLAVGGCYVAHNVSDRAWGIGGTVEFYRYIKSKKSMETVIDTGGSGMSISIKTTD